MIQRAHGFLREHTAARVALCVMTLSGITLLYTTSAVDAQRADSLTLSTGQLPPRTGAQGPVPTQYSATLQFYSTTVNETRPGVGINFLQPGPNGAEIPDDRFQLLGADGRVVPSMVRGQPVYDPAILSQNLPVQVNYRTGDARELVSLGALNAGNWDPIYGFLRDQANTPGSANTEPPPPGLFGARPGTSQSGAPSAATNGGSGPNGGSTTGSGGSAAGTAGGGGAGGGSGGIVPCGSTRPCTIDELKILGRNVFNTLLGLGAIAALAALVIGGFRYIMGRGDPKAMAEGKQIVMWAIIGLLVLLLAFVIVNTILTALQVGSEFRQ